jgi:eukaryotic-like serine/threonine-protein kinase
LSKPPLKKSVIPTPKLAGRVANVFRSPRFDWDGCHPLATFVNKTGDPVFDNSLDKALEVKLGESPFLSILSEADTRATMRTMRHDPSEPVTKELGVEICKRKGLKAVVVPEITAFGNRYLITLDAIEARSQMSIARLQEEVEKKDKVIPALGKAASRLRKRLGENLSALEQYNAPLDLATTSSLEALQAYSLGQTMYRTGKRQEAIPLHERAVELDPQFCSAYVALGRAYHSTGDDEASRKNFARAFELKDGRLTQQENFETMALYHAAITGNLEKESAVLNLYKLAYPHSVNAHNLLGIAQVFQGKIEEALREFTWSIDHSPVSSSALNFNASQPLVFLGHFDEGKGMLEQWRQTGSFSPFQRELRYRIAFLENDAASMERLAHEAPDDNILLHLQEEIAFLRGDFHKLRSLNETIVRQQQHAKRMENAGYELAWHAGVESFAGNYALAQKLRRAAEGSGDDSAAALLECAKAIGYAGDAKQGQALGAKLDRRFPEDTFQQQVILPVIRSVSERQRGNAEKAANLLAPVTQYPNVLVYYHRGLAYIAAERYSNAAADFQTLLAHRGWPEWEIFGPLHNSVSRARMQSKETRKKGAKLTMISSRLGKTRTPTSQYSDKLRWSTRNSLQAEIPLPPHYASSNRVALQDLSLGLFSVIGVTSPFHQLLGEIARVC